ncbi:hypothetical protein MKX01_012025 [Papaver californicum]|nr:hypothetical protein MKX01_012025 [Papaver californicum]
MGISIHHLLNHYPETQQVYSVIIGDDQIVTFVTKHSSTIDHWINRIYNDYNGVLDHLTVGLDVEWEPAYGHYINRITTLQLCVGYRCFIFQIKHADEIPCSHVEFLGNLDFTFVGVGIDEDVMKLDDDYNLDLWMLLILGIWLLIFVLNCGDIEKPRYVTLSNWEDYWLSLNQIKYAYVDACVSFKIGKELL